MSLYHFFQGVSTSRVCTLCRDGLIRYPWGKPCTFQDQWPAMCLSLVTVASFLVLCVWCAVCDTAFATAPDYVQQHLHLGVESDFCSAECEVYLAFRAYWPSLVFPLQHIIRCKPMGCVRLGLYAPKARKARHTHTLLQAAVYMYI